MSLANSHEVSNPIAETNAGKDGSDAGKDKRALSYRQTASKRFLTVDLEADELEAATAGSHGPAGHHVDQHTRRKDHGGADYGSRGDRRY